MTALPFAEFYLTDGSEYVNLLTPRSQSGFAIQEWSPLTPAPKDGGIFQGSPLSDGRRLVMRNYDNTVESLTLAGIGSLPDSLIFESQRVRRLLEKAIYYWVSEWQSAPVYIIARGVKETHERYGLLFDYRAPGDGNPFASPFTGPDAAIFGEWELVLEHDAWREVAPGQSVCVELSGTQTINTQKSFYPEANLDDVYVVPASSTLVDVSSLQLGKVSGNARNAGIRFKSVSVPPGATIVRAFLKLQVAQTTALDTVSLKLYGEASITPAIFSTFANFAARTLTTANVAWGSIADWAIGQTITTPDLAPVIQEIIDLPSWASGNNLVVFLNDNGSSNNAFRVAASYNNTIYAPPELVIVYDTPDILGREATCLPEVYLGNQRTEANITDIYYFDASTATFSPNVMTAALPTQLFPLVPAASDILYILLDFTVPGSLVPFASVVWDILTAQTGITGVAYEYWDGAAWVALTIQDNTAVGGIPFSLTGVGSMHWAQPVDWDFAVVNGVTGLAIRIRITSVLAPTPPTQQNRAPYSITWSNVDIASDQVGGDLPALARHKIFTQSGLGNQRTLIGLRSVSRGVSFTSMLNWSDVQNPTGITCALFAHADINFVADSRSPTGRCVEYEITGSDALRDIAYIQINNTISNHFYGRFRAFLRLTVDVGTANDIGVQLSYGGLSQSVFSVTLPIVKLPFIDEWLLVDMGQIVIPGSSTLQRSDVLNNFYFTVSMSHDEDMDLKLYDLVLIPIDEWGGDLVTPNTSGLSSISPPNYLDADSILYPKSGTPVRAFQRDGSDNDVISVWQSIASQPMILQANAEQQVYLLSAVLDDSSDMQQAFGEIAHKIQTERVQRYLSMRGNR